MKNPPVAKFYIAEIVRIVDNNSKPDLLGLFPGDILSLIMTEDSADPSREFPVGVQNFSIYVWVKDSVVGTPKTFEITAPDGKSIFPEVVKIGNDNDVPQPGAINTVIQLPGFPVIGFGEYRVNVTFTEHVYEFSFMVDKIISPNGLNFKPPEIKVEVS